MKAAVFDRYGPPEVLEVREVPKPVPGDDEVLVRVHATTVCAADWRIRKADPFFIRIMSGVTRPKIRVLGAEFSGTVESVGRRVTGFQPGDEVFGTNGFRFGGHAEYVAAPEVQVAKKPANMPLE